MKGKSTALSTTIAFWTRKLSLFLLITGYLCTPVWASLRETEIVDKLRVNQDRVTVRIKVKGDTDRPIIDLGNDNFRLLVDGKEVQFKSQDWKSPEEATPPPAWVIVLLDLSGSMAFEDSKGTTKLEGAINAIREFIDVTASRGGSTKIALIPFGEPGTRCEGYKLDSQAVNKNNFFLATDSSLFQRLEVFESASLCASTNLYQPIKKAFQFLGNTNDSDFYPSEESKKPQPRLSIILLSDGYHTQPNEEKDFEDLTELLTSNDNIIIHTLGYGLTPEELGEKYQLGKPATRGDIGEGKGKVPAAEFVDRGRLAEIAQLTGGIAEFSGDATEIAANLRLFLNALLGEYEITYTHPNAERGSKHEVKVVVISEEERGITSESKGYTIPVFGRSLPLKIRLIMLLCIFLALGLGSFVFFQWGSRLKNRGI